MNRSRAFFLLLTALTCATPLAAKPRAPKYPRVDIITPRPRPPQRSDVANAPPEPPIDLSKALPGKALAGLPSSAAQLGSLKTELARDAPALGAAKQKSETLASQAEDSRRKLVATAARIEDLESQKIALDARIVQLQAQDVALTQSFARDRISVTRLLAILERLQHDMPPALAVRPDDALAAARGAMLVGASLPPVYDRAAALARRIDALKATRLALIARRADALATASALAKARADLEILTAQKEQEAAGAADTYGALKAKLAVIAAQAADFQALVTRVAGLRRAGAGAAEQSIVIVTAQNGGAFGPLTKGSLLPPVVGTALSRNTQNAKNPGITYAALGGAQVIAPADGKVLFAGPYHKDGQVLILEISTGYDLVLAGLGRVTVRPDDELLAGEPIGNMPGDSAANPVQRLYFELRQNGHGMDPGPWVSLELRKAKNT